MKTRILIIDDESIVRRFAEEVLGTHDFCCSSAASSAEAAELLKQKSFELVLCDIRMPGGSGLDLLSYIREQYPDIAVMMMTGIDEPKWAAMAIEAGAYAYMVKPFESNELLINVQSSLRRRDLELKHKEYTELLESRVREKTATLEATLMELDSSYAFLRSTLDALTTGVAIIDESGAIVYSNRAWRDDQVTGVDLDEAFRNGANLLTLLESNGDDAGRLLATGIRSIISGEKQKFRCEYQRKNSGKPSWFAACVTQFSSGTWRRFVVAKENKTEAKNLEMQLTQAQRLESVGQLAAGVAHEINTPMQYLGDNLEFVKKKVQELEPLLQDVSRIADVFDSPDVCVELINRIRAKLGKINVESNVEEVQEALDDSRGGVQHVSRIVGAMKQFAHPGQEEKSLVDINCALASTITVSTNEWKYVAEIETDLADSLPLVPALAGELNQVFLNLLVNAAHAVADRYEGGALGKGTINLRTRHFGNYVEISISDTGCGIRDEIKQRIFDPFFTTKEVGRGTGQGLAIAHSVIISKHRGRLWCDSTPGVGSTFTVLLPIESSREIDQEVSEVAAIEQGAF